MELKDFIEKTIGAILDATESLQSDHADGGAVINPPVARGGELNFTEDSILHIGRRIELIEFDLAVTVASENEASGNAGITILSASLGAKGSTSKSSEEVSRVKFTIPIALSASESQKRNRRLFDKRN